MMVRVPVPWAKPTEEEVLRTLGEQGPVMRFEELAEGKGEMGLRETLDDLVISGEIERFPVGDHLMIKRTE